MAIFRIIAVLVNLALVAAGPEELSLLKQKVQSQGVVCEDMCKKVLEYPKCQCPGFGGMPADEDDTRSCEAKYCHPPAERCPNDAFFTCVQETTSVSFLQTEALPTLAELQRTAAS